MKPDTNDIQRAFATHRAAMQHLYRENRTNRRALWLLAVLGALHTVWNGILIYATVTR